jgi:hypothetical protein
MTWILLLTAGYPLARAWRANRSSSLVIATSWGLAAWVAWLTAALVSCYGWAGVARDISYLAVCLTGCAAVAVLGARRPGVGAWNFVVVGLLAVLLLQWLEGLEHLRDSPVRILFVVGTLGVGVLNYLPTRFGPAALALGTGCSLEFVRVVRPESRLASFDAASSLGSLLVAGSPWLALVAVQGRRATLTELDQIWLDFRDRFGLVWGQRVREQFNHSARHAGWPLRLEWQGFQVEHGSGEEAIVMFRALLKRFGADETQSRDSRGVDAL